MRKFFHVHVELPPVQPLEPACGIDSIDSAVLDSDGGVHALGAVHGSVADSSLSHQRACRNLLGTAGVGVGRTRSRRRPPGCRRWS